MTETTETATDPKVDACIIEDRTESTFIVKYDKVKHTDGEELAQFIEFLEMSQLTVQKVGKVGPLMAKVITMVENSDRITLGTFINTLLKLDSLIRVLRGYRRARFPKWDSLPGSLRKGLVWIQPEAFDFYIAGKTPDELVRHMTGIGFSVGEKFRTEVLHKLQKGMNELK